MLNTWLIHRRDGSVIRGGLIDHRHNADYRALYPGRSAQEASRTTIDDSTILINANSRLEGSRESARTIIRDVHYPSAVKPGKDTLWKEKLEAIGWTFNLDYSVWRVAPKAKAIDKMFAVGFFMLSLTFCDEDRVVFCTRRRFIEMASLLSWYSVGFNLGTAFVHSLLKNVGWGNLEENQEVATTHAADDGGGRQNIIYSEIIFI